MPPKGFQRSSSHTGTHSQVSGIFPAIYTKAVIQAETILHNFSILTSISLTEKDVMIVCYG